MKRLFTLTVIVAMTVCVLAQAPQKISYQAVIRNSSGQLVASHVVGIRISILQGTATGMAVYVETHTTTTNANGLATIEIGGGALVSGTFSVINWALGPYYVKTETDPAGGTAYSITGTSQVLSVPYSLYATSAGNGSLWTQNGAKIYYNTGDVGIGISNPSAYLNIVGNSDMYHPLLLLTEDQADYARLMFKSTALATKNWTIAGAFWTEDLQSRLNFHYYDGTTGKNLMSINGNGNVGIGIDYVPSAKLEVAGQVKIAGGAPGAGKVLTSDALGLASWQTPGPWLKSGDNLYYNAGYIGIGTNSPARLLHVYGIANPRILVESPDQAPELNLQRGSTTHALYVNGNLDLVFYCAGDRMSLTDDGKVGIGTTTPNYTLDVRGTIGNNTTLYHSDMRWKKDIQPIKYGVSELVKLNSVSYLWNANNYPDMGFDKETQFGFIAQEFEKVIPELVRTDKDGYKSIDYVKLTPVLVEAIKEQQLQIDELKSLVNELSAKLSAKSE